MAGELILIVEDNVKNLKLARDLLQFQGYRTLEAATATDGIEAAEQHLPDLVLLDIGLPDMDGCAALALLRAAPATAGIPVIAVTAYAMAADRERFRDAGFDGYVTKPIDIRDFTERVRQHLGSG